jgi:hypothetical protein
MASEEAREEGREEVIAATERPVRARVVLARELWRIARSALQSARELRAQGIHESAHRCVLEARRMVRLARQFDREEKA